ncbi:glycerol-3-phosphate dehydrogenase [Paenibacillus selenitireducens]|uniref:Aerobic glycerol-3-phosphate dehydrogenase n=1 Tax=Paenibacillus selenitireducens TaxID=1324314 RepID=A0A1T2X7H3_9BACL|nr:FAD-dependent oxidoreductase [Paenibacillus selenitireducens]OPA75775.1 glycerol-3-phosphate dehydrogenase [Paenibacillus selenitireducens]
MGRSLSSEQRERHLETMSEQYFDLLILGGGITGAGIALDAASRGLKTALVEMQDFAAGTSSRSTKLVHGGLRYLKQFDVKVVAEVGKERAIVYENGPHVTTPEWMLLPIYAGRTFGRWSTSVGLRLYDYLAGVKRQERRHMLSKAEALAKEPLLQSKGLRGGGLYVEYRTDDARLTIEVLKKAVELGAFAVNYTRATKFVYEEGIVQGAQVQDLIRDKSYTLRAQHVINAGGPWVDELRGLDGSRMGSSLYLTKGVHLVFDQSCFPLRQAIYFDTPDGRMIFAIPREGKTYIGTTDTEYHGDIAHPRVALQDRDYLLNAANVMFPSLELTSDDVESSWAGLRPLIHQAGKNPSEISRRDEVFHAPSGLISIAGGKLTGYRHMAENVVNRVVNERRVKGLDTGGRPCRTKNLPISGGDIGGSQAFEAFIRERVKQGTAYGLTKEESSRLAHRYGTNVDILMELIPACRQEWRRYDDMPLALLAELAYSLQYEMTITPSDFFIRRTGALLFHKDDVHKYREPVIRYMANRLNWSYAEREKHSQELKQHVIESITVIREI